MNTFTPTAESLATRFDGNEAQDRKSDSDWFEWAKDFKRFAYHNSLTETEACEKIGRERMRIRYHVLPITKIAKRKILSFHDLETITLDEYLAEKRPKAEEPESPDDSKPKGGGPGRSKNNTTAEDEEPPEGEEEPGKFNDDDAIRILRGQLTAIFSELAKHVKSEDREAQRRSLYALVDEMLA